MIRLGVSGKVSEPEWLEFPAFATGEGEGRQVPAWLLDPPTLAHERAARSIARRAVPGRDEGESDEAYLERLRETVAAWGATLPEGRLDLEARVSGAVSAIALTAMAEALIRDWRGFGDDEGEAIEPSSLAIQAAMRQVSIANRFEAWLSGKLAGRQAEGNA